MIQKSWNFANYVFHAPTYLWTVGKERSNNKTSSKSYVRGRKACWYTYSGSRHRRNWKRVIWTSWPIEGFWRRSSKIHRWSAMLSIPYGVLIGSEPRTDWQEAFYFGGQLFTSQPWEQILGGRRPPMEGWTCHWFFVIAPWTWLESKCYHLWPPHWKHAHEAVQPGQNPL